MSEVIKIQLRHGQDRYEVLLESENMTVEELVKKVEAVTGVPSLGQKLIFKGKSLSAPLEKLHSLGIVNNSKLMLIGRKFNVQDENHLKFMDDVEKVLNAYEGRLGESQKQYLEAKKALKDDSLKEALIQLKKKFLVLAEQLTRLLEKLDSLILSESTVEIQTRRRNLVEDIQTCLCEADVMIECIEDVDLKT